MQHCFIEINEFVAAHRTTEKNGFWDLRGIRNCPLRNKAVAKSPKNMKCHDEEMHRLKRAQRETGNASLKNTVGVCLQGNAMSLNAKWRSLIAGLNCTRLTLPIGPWSIAMQSAFWIITANTLWVRPTDRTIGTRYLGLQGVWYHIVMVRPQV